MNTITLTEIMNGAWKEYSIATCEERGIPQFADGLKPVQRFLLYQGFKSAKNHFDKVNAIGSSIAIHGYSHGEASATQALTAMGMDFCNNLPFFEGDGNFGNVLNPTPASPRYIFAKLASYIDLLVKDTDLCPEEEDPEIAIPKYYLPIIPMCLVNGIKGIATGYAVDIPPHDPVSIIDFLLKKCDKKKPKEIKPKYYNFEGTIDREDEKYVLTGIYEKKSPIHFVITELPHIFNTSASYEKHLRSLLEKGKIQNYENNSCDDKFCYEVWLKKGTRWTDEEIVKNLKLTSNHTWNLTTVMPDGKLHIWDKKTGIEDIAHAFYDFRLPFVQKRIEKKVFELKELIAYYEGFVKFIEAVIAKKVVLKDLTEEDFESLLLDKYKIPSKFVERVMNAPLRTFTTNKIEDLRKKLESANDDYSYYSSTTAEEEYKKDLEELKKVIK